MMAPRQTTGRLWLVSGLAVLFSSITAWATPIYSRMEFWLRGPLLPAYQGLLLLGLIRFLLSWLMSTIFPSNAE